MLNFLLAPLQYTFMWRSLAAAAIVGLVCAVGGNFVVLRGMAFFGDALSHAILPGVAVSYLVGGTQGPLFWGALAAAVLTALGIGKISQDEINRPAACPFYEGLCGLAAPLIPAYHDNMRACLRETGGGPQPHTAMTSPRRIPHISAPI